MPSTTMCRIRPPLLRQMAIPETFDDDFMMGNPSTSAGHLAPPSVVPESPRPNKQQQPEFPSSPTSSGCLSIPVTVPPPNGVTQMRPVGKENKK